MEVNDLGFSLEPDNGPLKGVLIAFRIGEDDKPIDIDKNRYKKARRSFFQEPSEGGEEGGGRGEGREGREGGGPLRVVGSSSERTAV